MSFRTWCARRARDALALGCLVLVVTLVRNKMSAASSASGTAAATPPPRQKYCTRPVRALDEAKFAQLLWERSHGGKWRRIQGGMHKMGHQLPDTFQWQTAAGTDVPQISEDEVQKCLGTMGHHVLVGDSQMGWMLSYFKDWEKGNFGARYNPINDRIKWVPNSQGWDEIECRIGKLYYGYPTPRRKTTDTHMMSKFADCFDCSGCKPGASVYKFGMVEYLGMEFALDDEIRSPKYNTTQENIFMNYLPSRTRPDLIVFNTGLHDVGRSTVEQYEKRMADLADKVLAMRAKWDRNVAVVWLQTSAVCPQRQPPAWRNFTENPLIAKFNEAAHRVMVKRGIPVVDTFPISDPKHEFNMHSDGVHLKGVGGAYYKAVRDIVFGALCESYKTPYVMANENNKRCPRHRYNNKYECECQFY